jgi:hypothetical protein
MNNDYINFENFSEKQKSDFFEIFKEVSNQNKKIIHPAASFFNENGWVKISNFIDKNMANFLYYYVILAAKRCNYLEQVERKNPESLFGLFDDPQAPGDYSMYGDLTFDTLLSLSLENMNILTNKKLMPTYTYYRLYTTGTELKRHRDRESCEFSTTLCLGYDTSNIDQKIYPNYNWPIFVADKKNEKYGLPIYLQPGDMLIYKGCEIEHWREPYIGLNHAQVFLHYNDINGKNKNLYDNRPLLGLSEKYKDNKNLSVSNSLNLELDPEDVAVINENNVNIIE